MDFENECNEACKEWKEYDNKIKESEDYEQIAIWDNSCISPCDFCKVNGICMAVENFL